MIFRNDLQLAQVCKALLGRVRKSGLWENSGPTEEACELLAQNGGYLSSGERVMLLAAFALWNGAGKLPLGDVVATLDGEHLAALGRLFCCATYEDIEAWLDVQQAWAVKP